MNSARATWQRAGRPLRGLLTALPSSFLLLGLMLVALGGLPVILLQPSRMAESAGPARFTPLQVAFAVSGAAAPAAEPLVWTPAALPHYRVLHQDSRGLASWYRVGFDADLRTDEPWAAYLPFLYNGGALWLNGTLVTQVMSSQPGLHVRWERPFLIGLPAGLLKPHGNELLLRLPPAPGAAILRMPAIDIAPEPLLLPIYERRLFWVRTIPQITVAVGLLLPCFVLFIWWRRRTEVLYGLFGMAVLLWAVRTLTFVVEVMPNEQWRWWRVSYHAATGGFVVVLALFALRYARWHRPVFDRALIAYALVGPLWMLFQGPSADTLVGYVWGGGLIPIGLSAVLATAWAAIARRDRTAALLLVALALALGAGVHDYLMSFSAGLLQQRLPEWTQQRVFLLHHAANLLLLVMGGLLTQRFIGALDSIQALNQTLEQRVTAREAELAENYQQLAVFQQEHAAGQERRRIMRDLHDGLGSQLFILLSRVERGDVRAPELSHSLRACIADMRLSLDVLAADEASLESAMADFVHRWRPLLQEAGVTLQWHSDIVQPVAWLSPHAVLQLLRLLQEALTNVVKHAGADQVRLRLDADPQRLRLSLDDNGKGFDPAARNAGRGLLNMQTRAAALPARLTLHSDAAGSHIVLEMPRPSEG